MKVTPELIREKKKSVMAFARELEVTPDAIYKAIKGNKYMDKLRFRIYESLEMSEQDIINFEIELFGGDNESDSV